ncbi:hypothetical protein [Albidovulum sp.]|uniref:RNA polymerase factor sigma-54 n=1 Tax=Albidovulum sp. TaxID=1872424 RepID=UPI003D7C8F86
MPSANAAPYMPPMPINRTWRIVGMQSAAFRRIASVSAGPPPVDEAICAQMKKEGVDIARRTVAKYHKCMRIPSSFGRRHRKVSDKNQPRDARKENYLLISNRSHATSG